jgi:Domain of unknown function (DUF4399)
MANILRASAICALIVIAACVMLSGCTTTPETPTVRITSPANGATVEAGDITINADVQNFNIVDKQGQANVTGEGHVHFYMDVTPLPSAAGQPAIPTDTAAVWAHVSDDEHTFVNVTPGTHIFAVQLVNNDHTPVVPTVSDMVTITVTTRS